MRLIRNTLLCATMLMGVGTTSAFAQEKPADAGAQGDSNDIVVTGSRRQTTLQDAPINISAVSAETLAKERVDDIRGIAAFTPGVTVVDAGPAAAGNIILRGINS